MIIIKYILVLVSLVLYYPRSTYSEISEEDIIAIHRGVLSAEELVILSRELRKRKNNRVQGGDHSVLIQKLRKNRKKIDRIAEPIKNGVETTTTSSRKTVAKSIKKHVRDMSNLVKAIRKGDKLFQTYFKNRKDMTMKVRNIANGVKVTHTGTTKCAIDMIRGHAEKISVDFLQKGEMWPDDSWIEPASCSS